MNRCLQNLIDTLIAECQSKEELTKSSTLVILELLSFIEKEAFANEFLGWHWNVGSARVLAWFQQTGILSATEYIVDKYEEDSGTVQLIMNDLLELEFRLLANLCQHIDCVNSTSIRVMEILTEALQRLCRDLCDDPSLPLKNYMAALETHCLADQLNGIRMLHLKVFLEYSHQNTLSEALLNMRGWKNKDEASNKDSNMLLESIFQENRSNMLVNILQFSKAPNFECWRFYLRFLNILIRIVVSEDEVNDIKAIVKDYVNTMFRKYLDESCNHVFMVLMLTVRQICTYNEKIIGSYAMWFKSTIGEMKYTLSTTEFNATMETLINMIECENDPEVLKVHINTSVPAPTFCNNIVLNYKQLCRSRLIYCAKELEEADKYDEHAAEDMDVYVIND